MSVCAACAGRDRIGPRLPGLPEMRVIAGWLAAAAAAVALAGCAAPAVAPEITHTGAPNQWTGRFAATYTEGGYQPREERSSGRFVLRTRGDRKQLELSSPLGQTLAMVTLEPARATLEAADGRIYEADNAEALTERVFGWRVPVGNLPDWLQGRVATPTERDGARVVAGREHGWSIRFDRFDGDRPQRLSLDWPADAADGMRRLELRLLVDNAAHVAALP